KLPRRLLINDTGYDLLILYDVVIQPWQLEIVPTGLHFAISGGYYGQIQLRSFIAKQGVYTEGAKPQKVEKQQTTKATVDYGQRPQTSPHHKQISQAYEQYLKTD